MDVTAQFLEPICNFLTTHTDTQTVTPHPFIDALCPICEIIFDLMLEGYILSLEEYHNRSVKNSTKEGKLRQSLDKWDQAISSAHKALEKFRDAEKKHQIQLIDDANAIVQEVMASLKSRYGALTSSRVAPDHLSYIIA
jgi:predicted ribosome quality control (RQC) complex YloA/Tae2 family protein